MCISVASSRGFMHTQGCQPSFGQRGLSPLPNTGTRFLRHSSGSDHTSPWKHCAFLIFPCRVTQCGRWQGSGPLVMAGTGAWTVWEASRTGRGAVQRPGAGLPHPEPHCFGPSPSEKSPCRLLGMMEKAQAAWLPQLGRESHGHLVVPAPGHQLTCPFLLALFNAPRCGPLAAWPPAKEGEVGGAFYLITWCGSSGGAGGLPVTSLHHFPGQVQCISAWRV